MLSATQALTIFAEIEPGKLVELRARLKAIDDNLDGNAVFRPGQLPDTHFMRFVIIDDADHDGELPPLLAWEVNHDGSAGDYLAAVARAAPTLDRVLEACVGYPGTHRLDEWLAWMHAHSHRATGFYTGYRGVPRREIVNDLAVHEALREAVDGNRGALATLPPHEIQRRLREQVRTAHPELDISPIPDEDWRWRLGWVLAIAAVIVLSPLLLVIAGPWYLTLHRREQEDAHDHDPRPVHDDKGVAELEDRVTQNQLTHVVDIKPGMFRLFTVWIVLTAIDTLARVKYVHGELGGITSIHFARWVIVRDHRRDVAKRRHRLVFFSNYDGSWESYLGEFIDRASKGLTGVWSNTVGFPRTKRLLWEGADDEEAFKQWTRLHQIPTQVWWSGVPHSTVQNVRDDIWLRRRLDQTLDDKELARWLRLV